MKQRASKRGAKEGSIIKEGDVIMSFKLHLAVAAAMRASISLDNAQ